MTGMRKRLWAPQRPLADDKFRSQVGRQMERRHERVSSSDEKQRIARKAGSAWGRKKPVTLSGIAFLSDTSSPTTGETV